jgi:abortive infection bacteriophage resistance protein
MHTSFHCCGRYAHTILLLRSVCTHHSIVAVGMHTSFHCCGRYAHIIPLLRSVCTHHSIVAVGMHTSFHCCGRYAHIIPSEKICFVIYLIAIFWKEIYFTHIVSLISEKFGNTGQLLSTFFQYLHQPMIIVNVVVRNKMLCWFILALCD